MPADIERIPPNAVEAEKAILGAMIVNTDAVAKITSMLKPTNFYQKRHQAIFTAILELHEQKHPIDLLTVSQHLKDHGKLAQVGGRVYVTELTNSIVTTANVEAYAKSVREKHLLRKLIRVSHEMSTAAWNDNSAEALDKLAQLTAAMEEKAREGGLPTMNLADLISTRFEEPKWAIRPVLPEGLTVLAGAPKLGKSWMSLQIALAVATGGKVLGEYDTDQGEVLYLALEDNFRRLKDRIAIQTADMDISFNGNLHLCTELAGMEHGGLVALENWIKEHPACRLVIIDTLAKFLPAPESKSNAYQQDYRNFGQLQKLALKYKIALLGVHHMRKLKATDALDEVSGSSGVTGAADAIWVLKRARTENSGTLLMTGRDIEELQLEASFDNESCRWQIEGDARGKQTRDMAIKLSAAFAERPFTYETARDAFDGCSRTQCQRFIASLVSAGYVMQIDEKAGKALQFKLTERLADQFLGGAA